MLTQEHGTSQTEGAAQPVGSSQPPCISETTRRSKTVVPTVEKAIAIMEPNKKKKEEAGFAKVLDPKKETWIGLLAWTSTM